MDGWFRDAAEHRDREDQPPHGDTEERQARRDARVAQPKQRRLQDPRKVDGEQQATADIAERIAGARHAVQLVRPGDVGQQRVVEHEAGRNTDVDNDEQQRGELPLASGDEKHRRGGADADGQEDGQQALLHPRVVGVRPKDWRHHRDDDQRQRCRGGESLRGDGRR